jgi:hypothetical protein
VKNISLSFAIILVGTLMLVVINFIEFIFGIFGLPGNFISIILVLLVVVPFIEQMKSYAFILKFDLIGKAEIHQAMMKPKPKKIITAVRLREMPKGGKI